MSSVLQALNSARKAIWANQLGMDTTSHNIANVNTLGYTRQRVITSASDPLTLPEGQLGLGVTVESIERVRNFLLDQRFREVNDKFGYLSLKEEVFSRVEIILQEPSENAIGSLMNDFFLEFSNLAADPENVAIRNTIIQKSQLLVDSFRSKYEQLNSLQNSLKQDAINSVKIINDILNQIADLNGKISTVEDGIIKANDLRDKRDLLLDRLSKFFKINVIEDDLGNVTVAAEGLNLVSGTQANKFLVDTVSNNGEQQLIIRTSSGNEAVFKYGKMGGIFEMYNQKVVELKENLDNLAQALIENVNNLHVSGKGLPTGNPPRSSTGVHFFTGTGAMDINISEEILKNVNKIATSINGEPGNGDVALAIANLRNNKILNGGTETFEDYYTSIVKNLAIEIDSVTNMRESQQLLKNQIENQRQAESGVSLDEEMTNLIKYQRAFEAAAKIVQAVDEIMETLVNMV